jgi:hypothetical protein
MDQVRGTVAVRSIGALNAATGIALLARPEPVVRAVTSGRGVPAAEVVQVLGARLCLQGLLLAATPGRRVVALCAAVDLAHAASMYALCAVRPAYRRAATASALAATTTGMLTTAAAWARRRDRA